MFIKPRPVDNQVELDPKTTFAKIENIYDFNSRNTLYYPAELLEPNTTYNISGSIMGYSAWWTFTTASTFDQPEYEYNLTPYAWPIALTISIIATIIFIKKSGNHTK